MYAADPLDHSRFGSSAIQIEALATCRDGERLAREVAHPFSVTFALWATGMLHLLRRETDATLETGEAMIAHCGEKGFPPFIPLGGSSAAGRSPSEGELTAGIALLAEGIAGVRASGTEYTLPLFFAWLAEICCKAGRLEEAFAALEQGRAMSMKTEDRFILPEFHRLEGEMMLAHSAGNQAESEACFERSMHLAGAWTPSVCSCAPPPAWPACGASRADASRPTSVSRPYTTD